MTGLLLFYIMQIIIDIIILKLSYYDYYVYRTPRRLEQFYSGVAYKKRAHSRSGRNGEAITFGPQHSVCSPAVSRFPFPFSHVVNICITV